MMEVIGVGPISFRIFVEVVEKQWRDAPLSPLAIIEVGGINDVLSDKLRFILSLTKFIPHRQVEYVAILPFILLSTVAL